MYIKNSRFVFFYRTAVLLLSFYTVTAHLSFRDAAVSNHNFSYFTVQSNLLCLITYALLWNVSKNECATGNLSLRDRFSRLKGLTTLSLFITGLGFHMVLLRIPAYQAQYLPLTAKSLSAHYIMPSLTILDWFLFQPKGSLSLLDPFSWCLYPCLYYIIIMVRALSANPSMLKAAGTFPYPFLDVDQLGLTVLFYAACILGCFLISGCSFVVFDRFLYIIITKFSK